MRPKVQQINRFHVFGPFLEATTVPKWSQKCIQKRSAKRAKKNQGKTFRCLSTSAFKRRAAFGTFFNVGEGRKLDFDDPLNEFACFFNAGSCRTWFENAYISRRCLEDASGRNLVHFWLFFGDILVSEIGLKRHRIRTSIFGAILEVQNEPAGTTEGIDEPQVP